MALVAVVMGSKSDLPVARRCTETLERLSIGFELRIMSAHRTPSVVMEYALSARKKGIDVIVAIAGKAAHLAGVIAACTCLPVIGLPVKSSTLDGLDSLLSTVQMPKGVPVATVAIDGAENAALLATRILSIKYPQVGERLESYAQQMREEVLKSDEELRSNTEGGN